MKSESTLIAKETIAEGIQLLVGKEVLELLSDEKFLKGWDLLYQACPWATVYQSKEFVVTWYKQYYNRNLPIIVKAVLRKELTGLLTMALDENGLIVSAGTDQAEYQTWLTKVGDDTFIVEALSEVQKRFFGKDIRFRFLPDKTPIKWIETGQHWKKNCVLRVYHQPIMNINETIINQELRKKNRREKINRLKRMGELKFERITDFQTFACIFDELAAQFDFRKGAMYNKTPFHNFPVIKQFLLALFEQGLLHTTVLKLDDEIIASLVGTIGKSTVHLQGMNTHAPQFAKYSPGILHFLMLGKLLAKEGFDFFDLTPGGDSYKEGLATDHKLAYELRVAGSVKSYIKSLITKKIYDFILKDKISLFNRLGKVGITPTEVRKQIKSAIRKYQMFNERVELVKSLGVASLIHNFLNALVQNQTQIIYKPNYIPSEHNFISISRNNLHDLLKYFPYENNLTKWEFLSEAMEKFIEGAHVFTLSDESRLLCSVWLKITQKKRCNKGDAAIASKLPEGSILLYDIYHLSVEKDKLKAFITAAVREATKTFNVKEPFIVANSEDHFLIQILEGSEFVKTSMKQAFAK